MTDLHGQEREALPDAERVAMQAHYSEVSGNPWGAEAWDCENWEDSWRACLKRRAALAAREEPPTHFEWPEHYEVGETQTTACEIPLDGRSHTSYRKEVSCVACLQTMLAAAREGTERPEWKGHKLKLTIEDGGVYVYADLICPETGCDPPNICGQCGRSWDDGETERCYDCPTEKPKGCWLAGWDELAECLHGKVVVTVDIDAEWDTDAPSLTVVRDTGQEHEP